MPNSIQPREYSRGSGTDGFSRISDGDTNLLGANRNDDGHWLNAYYDKPDNRWNRDNGFAFAVSLISSFSLSSFERVLFNNLSRPSAKISADLVQL